MFVLLRRCDLKAIRLKFTTIYILNILDIIFTLILIKTGLFIEGNYFMSQIIGNSALVLAIKVIIVGALLAILYKRMETATIKQLAISNIFINSCMGVYILINLSHVIWALFSFFYFSFSTKV
jgi:hypothetical protein